MKVQVLLLLAAVASCVVAEPLDLSVDSVKNEIGLKQDYPVKLENDNSINNNELLDNINNQKSNEGETGLDQVIYENPMPLPVPIPNKKK
jgi:hypothetical protein